MTVTLEICPRCCQRTHRETVNTAELRAVTVGKEKHSVVDPSMNWACLINQMR